MDFSQVLYRLSDKSEKLDEENEVSCKHVPIDSEGRFAMDGRV